MVSFAERLDDTFLQFGHLCVGIDPHPYLLDLWELDNNAAGVREFSLRVLDACVDVVGVIKPQVSFFERCGSAGYAALEILLERARQADVMVIADAKRGDIGSTMDGYVEAWLTPSSPLASDAVTISPYLGVGSLDGLISRALEEERGVFVLGVTSNPEAASLQSARVIENDTTVAADIVRQLRSRDSNELSSVGVVIGATIDLDAYGINRDDLHGMPILAPGFGAQGARISDARSRFGSLCARLLVAQSRNILETGPAGVAEAIRRSAGEVADALG